MCIQGTWADALVIQAVADTLKVTLQIVESNQGFAPLITVYLQSPTKVLARLHTFAVSITQIYQFIPLPPNSMLFIVIKSSLPVSNIVRGKGAPFSTDVITFVSKIACQRIFMQSDPGVPRTSVEDCSSGEKYFVYNYYRSY